MTKTLITLAVITTIACAQGAGTFAQPTAVDAGSDAGSDAGVDAGPWGSPIVIVDSGMGPFVVDAGKGKKK